MRDAVLPLGFILFMGISLLDVGSTRLWVVLPLCCRDDNP